MKIEFKNLMISTIFAVCLFTVFTGFSGNIDATDKYAWNANSGWTDMETDSGSVTVYDNYLSGYAWNENTGWIKLGSAGGGPYNNTNASNWGVNNDGNGNLTGYAWSANCGWINFSTPQSQVKIDTSGNFSGYAWNENTGWIHFANSETLTYKVKTSWVPSYTITANAGENGTVSPTTQNVKYGNASSEIIATANAHYHFLKWDDRNTDNPRIISNVTAPVTINATFAIDQFTVTANKTGNGTVSPTTQNVNYGNASSEIIATANAHYHFLKWDDGNTDNPRIISNVTENTIISAEFTLNTYAVTFETDGTKGITLNGELSQTVEYKGNCSIVNATGNDKVTFKNWTGTNGFETTEENPLTVTNVISDMVIIANFIPQNISLGNIVTVNSKDVPSLSEGFIKTPKLYAELTPIGSSKIKRFTLGKLSKIRKGTPSEVFQAIWKKAIPLFNKKALKNANKTGILSSIWLQFNPIANQPFNLKIKTKDSNGQKINDDLGVRELTPPVVSGIFKENGEEVTDSINKGDTIIVKGSFFGTKAPKVSLEYLDASGKIKRLKLKVLKPLAYTNAKGKSGKSCMDPITGDSQIKLQILSTSKALPDGSDGVFDLIIDNKFGIAINKSTTKVPKIKIIK